MNPKDFGLLEKLAEGEVVKLADVDKLSVDRLKGRGLVYTIFDQVYLCEPPGALHDPAFIRWLLADLGKRIKGAEAVVLVRRDKVRRMSLSLRRKRAARRRSHPKDADIETEIKLLRAANSKLSRWIRDARRRLKRLEKAAAEGRLILNLEERATP